MSDCLIELGTEELPPKALLKLSSAFTTGVTQRLKDAQLEIDTVESFATPRRLASKIGPEPKGSGLFFEPKHQYSTEIRRSDPIGAGTFRRAD